MCLSASARLFVVTLFILACISTSHAVDNTLHPNESDHDEWVVVLKDPRPKRLQGFQVKGYSGHYSNSLELKRFGKRIAKEYSLSLQKAWFIESLKVYCLIVKLDKDQAQTLQALGSDERVNWVQRSNNFELLKSTSNSPSDPFSNIAQIDYASDALQLDGAGVKIALVDSAVASDHPGLAKSITLNRDLVVGATSGQSQGEHHGTAMAGIMVGVPDNQVAQTGVAPAAEVLAYRGCWEVSNDDTRCNTLSLARALDGVIKAKPAILNLSLSGPRDRLLDGLINVLVEQGVFIVAAFDPKRTNDERFPTRRDGVLIVRAEHMHTDYKGEFTAPGKRIVLSPTADFETMSGHSVATAYTSGLLALMVQAIENNESISFTDMLDAKGNLKPENAQQLIELNTQFQSPQKKAGV